MTGCPALRAIPALWSVSPILGRGGRWAAPVPAAGEVGLVMPDGVLVEDGDVAVEGLQVQVAEKGRTDVDR